MIKPSNNYNGEDEYILLSPRSSWWSRFVRLGGLASFALVVSARSPWWSLLVRLGGLCSFALEILLRKETDNTHFALNVFQRFRAALIS